MGRQTEQVASDRRRTVLRLVGAAGGLGFLGAPTAAQEQDDADGGASIAVRQGGQCSTVAPLSGEEPVEALYEYTYPTSQFEGPSGAPGTTYSSEGTVDLQRERGSVVFLYDGPGGRSLVLVHGRVDEAERGRPVDESTAGGAVSARFRGLPDSGRWVVLDDYYAVDGEQSPSNFDRYERDGDVYTFHWLYRGGRTDGGVFRGLGDDLDVEVVPGFNERAGHFGVRDYGTVERWEFLSGDREDPDRLPLALDQPVQITASGCDGEGSEWSDDAEDRTDD